MGVKGCEKSTRNRTIDGEVVIFSGREIEQCHCQANPVFFAAECQRCLNQLLLLGIELVVLHVGAGHGGRARVRALQ